MQHVFTICKSIAQLTTQQEYSVDEYEYLLHALYKELQPDDVEYFYSQSQSNVFIPSFVLCWFIQHNHTKAFQVITKDRNDPSILLQNDILDHIIFYNNTELLKYVLEPILESAYWTKLKLDQLDTIRQPIHFCLDKCIDYHQAECLQFFEHVLTCNDNPSYTLLQPILRQSSTRRSNTIGEKHMSKVLSYGDLDFLVQIVNIYALSQINPLVLVATPRFRFNASTFNILEFLYNQFTHNFDQDLSLLYVHVVLYCVRTDESFKDNVWLQFLLQKQVCISFQFFQECFKLVHKEQCVDSLADCLSFVYDGIASNWFLHQSFANTVWIDNMYEILNYLISNITFNLFSFDLFTLYLDFMVNISEQPIDNHRLQETFKYLFSTGMLKFSVDQDDEEACRLREPISYEERMRCVERYYMCTSILQFRFHFSPEEHVMYKPHETTVELMISLNSLYASKQSTQSFGFQSCIARWFIIARSNRYLSVFICLLLRCSLFLPSKFQRIEDIHEMLISKRIPFHFNSPELHELFHTKSGRNFLRMHVYDPSSIGHLYIHHPVIQTYDKRFSCDDVTQPVKEFFQYQEELHQELLLCFSSDVFTISKDVISNILFLFL